MTSLPLAAVLMVAGLLVLPRTAGAHRLDEYLQATRLDVGPREIGVEVSLTPGAQVADDILSAIDRDRDGTIDAREAAAYASRVAADLAVRVDGRPHPLAVRHHTFPEPSAIRAGTGIIRVSASLPIDSPAGSHRITFANRHMTANSVYLVNTLVPADPTVTIGTQTRDHLQRELTVDYSVSGRTPQQVLWLLAAAGLLGTAIAGRAGMLHRLRLSLFSPARPPDP